MADAHRRRALEDQARLRKPIHRAQGATVTRTLVVTGGWQTSKEAAYVEASRARGGTDWHVNRQDLGEHGHDTNRIKRLARDMGRSRAQAPSLAHRELSDYRRGTDFDRGIERYGPDRCAPRLPGRLFALIRTIHRARQAQEPGARDERIAGTFHQSGAPQAAVRYRPLTADDVMTTRDVALLLHAPISTVEDWARRDILPSVKVGSRRLYIRQSIESALLGDVHDDRPE